jgi:protein-disulfide isomerase
MNTALGVVGGLVVGAAVGFGVATVYKGGAGGLSMAGGSDPVVMELDGTKCNTLFEVKEESANRTDAVLNQFALQFALAKDKNKDVKASALPPLEQLVDVPAPSEEEMQALFDANKARLPPETTYDKIKPEIEKYMRNQKVSEALRAKNEEFKAKNRVKLLTQHPVPPEVELDLKPFPSKGSSGPTLVMVADYLCPHCQATAPEVEAAVKDLGDKIKFVAVSYALRPDALSGTLARGAFCARQQGDEAFWKYHTAAFQNGREKGWKQTDPDAKDPVVAVATAAGIDAAKVEACLSTPEAQAFVTTTSDSMQKAGVSGTPTFFLNGRKMALQPGKSFKDLVLSHMQGASH